MTESLKNNAYESKRGVIIRKCVVFILKKDFLPEFNSENYLTKNKHGFTARSRYDSLCN